MFDSPNESCPEATSEGENPPPIGIPKWATEPLVITHKNCNDGFGAAWVLRGVFPAADFHPAYHDTPPPDVDGRDVIMADFAYPRAETEAILSRCRSFTLLDHHVTSAAKLAGLPNCHFDLTKSAARLTYDRLVEWGWLPPEPPPPLVLYVEDRDLNRWVLPDTRAVNAALTAYRMDFDEWTRFNSRLTQDRDAILAQGHLILGFQDMLISSIVSHAREVTLEHYQVLASNTSVLWGECAERLAHNRPFGLAWYRREDGKFVYSFRSGDDGVDVEKIAEHYGGGGHAHMAGVCTDRPIIT
jgi:hypothetical protein